MMSRDMSGRFAPIYSTMIVKPGVPGPAGTLVYGFTEQSAYTNEVLVVGERAGREPYVARCLSEPSAEESLAPCQRDIHIGDSLSLSYRFPKELLANWRDLDAAIQARSSQMLKIWN